MEGHKIINASVMEREKGSREEKQQSFGWRRRKMINCVILSQEIIDKKTILQSSEEDLEVTGSKAKKIAVVNLQEIAATGRQEETYTFISSQ